MFNCKNKIKVLKNIYITVFKFFIQNVFDCSSYNMPNILKKKYECRKKCTLTIIIIHHDELVVV